MNDRLKLPESGWTFWKALGLVVGVLGMVGFGLCGLCGLTFAIGSHSTAGTFLAFAIPGLIVSFLCFLLARKMTRLAKPKKPSPPPS